MSEAADQSKVTWIRSVLDEHEGPLTRYVAGLTGNAESARDIVQEAFLRLCREQPAELNGRVRQWLYAVCRHQAIDARRKDQTVKAMLVEARPRSRDQSSGDCETDPAVVAETRDGASNMLSVLATLPGNQQEVIRLRFQNGMSYKEIAEVTKLSVTNVGYLIHTAIQTMRARLTDHDDEPSRDS